MVAAIFKILDIFAIKILAADAAELAHADVAAHAAGLDDGAVLVEYLDLF